MSAPGHCHHCRDGCPGGETPIGVTVRHQSGMCASWADGHCIGCDEITRIVAEIAAAVAELNRAGEWSESREVDGLIHAATIARGEA